MKSYLQLILSAASLLSLTLFSSVSFAASTPVYKIEVIVFESLNLKGWTEEYWPEDTALPDTSNSTNLFSNNKKPLWIRNSGKELSGKANILNKKGYRVLFHQAWTQAAYPNKNAPKVLIESSSQYGSNMLGTVRLYKTRFAHVDFDLELERRIPSKIMDSFAENQNLASNSLPSKWRFNLKESRKIRPGELHYLDHPLFGVIVKVNPID